MNIIKNVYPTALFSIFLVLFYPIASLLIIYAKYNVDKWCARCCWTSSEEEKKTYGNYGDFLTYRNRITKMVLAFVIAQHTANVEFRRIIVI